MRRAATLAIAAALSGCATEEGLRKRLDPTIGMTEAALVAYANRLPDQTYSPDAPAPPAPANVGAKPGKGQTAAPPPASPKTKFLAWNISSASTAPGYWSCVRGWCVVQPPTTYAYFCNLIFQLEDGIVRGYRYNGNACAA